MLNNLPPFYIGQKVIYITGINMPKGIIDIVIDIKKCPCKCDTHMILLSKNKYEEEFLDSTIPLVECELCGNIVDVKDELEIMGYWLASSFRSLQEQTFPLISYSKVLDKELVCAN